ncbi:NAD(P)-dependent oxidoreductase [Allostreptomyces psammosilenae]|uniref:3-hydroxyisobutyrate dehydrogenase-like beta-hydroxyacid dehydrogenase n=1 Tax=Allostreptomyces psammosilenae TaxID=1892865 RepID=A0A852ZTA8_9ACTN|nr:NAD(P)-binding domain-containing protein [Allostreptomyces psammosilenae]NYI05643.1 3-hydroxyisobutyrate dehydrogenase-like beta-hydroxyacid dehydrogenase [Allostreptomyces psammosilenae]
MATDHPTASHAPVTVLGLGPMGQALAGALLRAGHPTTVWNRTPSKADALTAEGARRADTVAEAVSAGALVILCVRDYDAARKILAPATAALRGRTLVNLTSGAPDDARATAAWAAEHGVDYLDGTIMTPTHTIGQPSAVMLFGGPPELFDAHRPVLAALGGTATHLGADPGRAASYDTALLDLFWTAVAGCAHALAVARAENIAAGDLLPYAVGIAQLLPEVLTEFAADLDRGSFQGDGATIEAATAGMDHVLHTARSHGIDTGPLAAARAIAQRAIDAGHGADGLARLAAFLTAESPGE